MHFERPHFITPHAVGIWRKRIAQKDTPAQGIARIQEALQEPVFERPGKDGARIYGCRLQWDGRDVRFCCVVRDNPGQEWPAVVTLGEWWRWHEFRRLWGACSPRYRSMQAVQSRAFRSDVGEQPRAHQRWSYDEEDYAVRAIAYARPETIARRLGRSPLAVVQWLYHWHQGPTKQLWVTSGRAARIAGVTQQYLVRLAKAGTVRARRVPGGCWWLFDPKDVRRLAGERAWQSSSMRH